MIRCIWAHCTTVFFPQAFKEYCYSLKGSYRQQAFFAMLTGLATRTISRCCPKIEIQNFNMVKCKSTSLLSFPHSSHLYGHPFHSSYWTSPITPPPFKDKEVAQARRVFFFLFFFFFFFFFFFNGAFHIEGLSSLVTLHFLKLR